MFAQVFKFDQHQPRDNHGRWTTDFPGSGMRYDARDKKWVRSDGKNVPERDQKRLHDVKMPVVYTDVRVNPDVDADLVAVGTNSVGKMQYRYSAKHSEKADPEKFARAKAYHKVRQEMLTKAHVIMASRSKSTHERDTAATLILIDKSAIRNGGSSEKAYGATDLLNRQVTVNGDRIRLRFRGKHGVAQDHTVREGELATHLGKRKTQSHANDKLLETTSHGNIVMLRELTGNAHFKVHDIRTWNGTALALALMKKNKKVPKDHAEFVRMRNEIGERVARKLGNDKAAAIKSYIDPTVWKKWKHAEFINMPKRRTRKDDEEFSTQELEDLMDEYFDSIEYDTALSWEFMPETDDDPDEES